MSEIKVNSIKGVGASAAAITVNNTDGTCTANITNNLSNRNLVINGAMQVAQRGTSSTTNGYGSVDRVQPYSANTSVTTTHSQVAVTSGGAYDAGFRKAFQVTKPAGSVAANGQIAINYAIEGQDIVNSGWKMTDPNSKLTLSFWVKSSVANHNPTFYVQAYDTPSATQFFNGQVSALTADTWTKVTTVIPGHADIGIANDNTKGLVIGLNPWYGTDFTDAGNTNGAWTTFGTKPVDSTWLTTNGSTFQVTGYQLEVGSVATDFEHRSFGQELELCKRYYQQINGDYDDYTGFSAYSESATSMRAIVYLSPPMRAAFTHSKSGVFRFQGGTNDSNDAANAFDLHGVNTSFNGCTIRSTAYSGMGAADRPGNLQFRQNGSKLKFDAEL
jgi:hypothetical protein